MTSKQDTIAFREYDFISTLTVTGIVESVGSAQANP